MKTPDQTLELEPFERRKVAAAKFKPEIPASRLKDLWGTPAAFTRFQGLFFPIERLSVTKTVGTGRTNLTFIRPTMVQVDATVPFAGFDRTQSPTRAPAMQMHSEPQAYGITGPANYAMEFTIETFGPAAFRVDGSFGFITNAGPVSVNGRVVITLAFQNVPPTEQIFGFIEQTAGERWNWFSAS